MYSGKSFFLSQPPPLSARSTAAPMDVFESVLPTRVNQPTQHRCTRAFLYILLSVPLLSDDLPRYLDGYADRMFGAISRNA